MERTEINKREAGENIEDLETFLRENIRRIFSVIDAVRHGHSFYMEKWIRNCQIFRLKEVFRDFNIKI